MEQEDQPKSRSRESLEQLYDSAIEAERQTGKHESTKTAAKRSLIARITSIFAGTAITVIGAIMLVTPGPGLLIVACGLGILAIDVPFARRLLNIVKSRLPQDEQGKITKRTIIAMIVTAFVGIIISVIATWLALANRL